MITEKEAKAIITMCDELEAFTINQTTSIKAMVYASLGGVGTTQSKQKENKKYERELKIRQQFRKK